MGYEDAFHDAWVAGGPAGALAFLRDLFHAPENQRIQGKPSDYLREDAKPTPAAGFDALVRWFAPVGPLQRRVDFVIERLVERRTAEDDQAHAFQPFNGFRLQIGDYDWGDAVLDSVSIDAEAGTWRRQYGLNHQILEGHDNTAGAVEPEEAEYTFVYDLSKETGSPYPLAFRGERVAGQRLFVHLRAAQYGAWAATLVDALFADERFADFPKAFPFRCFVSTRDYTREGKVGRLEFHPPITADTLTGPLRDRLLRAAARPEPPSVEQRFTFLLRSGAAGRAELGALLADHPALAQRVRGFAEASLEGAPAPEWDQLWPRDWAALGWGFDPVWAADYLGRIFRRPLPELPHRDLEQALAFANAVLDDRFGGWRDAPEGVRAALEPHFAAAGAELVGASHPVWRLLGLEQVYRAHQGLPPKIGRHTPPFGDTLPEGYLDALAGCIDELPETFQWYGEKWSLVGDRLEWLGKRGRPLAERLVRLMNAWCTGLQDGGQAIRMFAALLQGMGLEEPPPLVRAHVERDRYHGIDGYAAWAAGAIDAKWDTFAARYAADPAAFRSAAAWEQATYPSEAGYTRFHERMRAAPGMVEAFEDAYAREPAPALAGFARVMAKHYQRRDPGTDHARHLVRLLAATPDLEPAERRTLRAARIRLAWAAVDARDPAADAALDEVARHEPDAPALGYLRAALAFDRDGPLAAGQVVADAVRALVGDDLVYRKAFATYVGVPVERAEPLDGYVLFRWAADRVRREHTTAGRWTGGEDACLEDPLYEALARWVSPWTDEARAVAVAEVREEAAFLATWRGATDEALAQKLVPTQWALSWQILRQLMRAPERWADRAVEVYRWYRGDEVRRRAILELCWPLAPVQEPLLRDPAFQQDLPWFFARYPGISAAELARTCFGRLIELGLPEVVLQVVEQLPGETVVAVFVTVNRALEAVGDPEAGVRVLEGVLARANPKHPDYVVVASNLAALYMRSGDLVRAEQVLDQLFAMDWSRFDPVPDDDDGFAREVLGFDLDDQLRAAFRQYFALAKYNAACLYGLTGRAEPCVAALRAAAAAHPPQVTLEKIEGDTDFDPVRGEPGFAAWVDELESAEFGDEGGEE